MLKFRLLTQSLNFKEKFYSVKKDSIVVQCEEHDTSQWSSTTTFGFRNKIYRNVLNKIDMNCLKDDCNPDDSNDVQCCFPDKFKTEVLQYSNHIIFSNTHSDSEKTFYVSNKTFDSPLSLFCPLEPIYKSTEKSYENFIIRPFPSLQDINSIIHDFNEKVFDELMQLHEESKDICNQISSLVKAKT